MTAKTEWLGVPGIFLVAICYAAAPHSAAYGQGASMDSSGFAGVNWADGRDNFVDGWIIPSGIDHRLSRPEVAAQASSILIELKKKLCINTVRLGINPSTVKDNTWWPKYQIIIREAVALDLNVILACWESKSSRDGKIDDLGEFSVMWDQVIENYKNTSGVYFEIFNEPHGYSDKEWRGIANDWLTRYVPLIEGEERGRVFISGAGCNERLTGIASDRRFNGCKLSFHLYAWFGQHDTVAGWQRELADRIGPENARRTVVTEWGAPMKGLPHDHYTSAAPDGDRNRSYLVAMSGTIRDWRMGSIYWPGLRDGDTFSLTQRDMDTSLLKLTNDSGRALLLHSFNRTRESKPVDAQSDRSD